jgi:UDP-N-acetylmuramate--alanine ligase
MTQKKIFRKSRRMHFIGIGGIGMSGIAEILINMGYEVSGSDLRESEQTRRLASLGAEIFIGHFPSNIRDYNVVVTSTAIDQTNPELIEAKRRRIPVIHRSEMLAEIVRLKHGIGVAGTHGKTTTSSVLASVLYSGGMNPTAVIGGKVFDFGSNARSGEGEYIVFEADESDGSFVKLLPCIGVVTNIDADHLDHYKYFEGIKDAFVVYLNNIPFYGYSVICIDDPAVRDIIPRIEKPFVTYGLSAEADFQAVEISTAGGRTSFRCLNGDDDLGVFETGLLGNHNVVNCLSVIAVSLELGLSADEIRKGLAAFSGVGRRLEVIGEHNGITVYDDYGHHPTEIRATLDALKTLSRRLVVIFQPHRYTRTQLLWDEFGQAFPNADCLFLTGIYPAGESPIEGVSSELIKDSVMKHEGREAVIITRFEDIPEAVLPVLKIGDIVVTLGAGDIHRAGPMLLQKIREAE